MMRIKLNLTKKLLITANGKGKVQNTKKKKGIFNFLWMFWGSLDSDTKNIKKYTPSHFKKSNNLTLTGHSSLLFLFSTRKNLKSRIKCTFFLCVLKGNKAKL